MAQDVALAKSSERHKINFIFNPAFGWSKLSPINFSFSATDTQQPFSCAHRQPVINHRRM